MTFSPALKVEPEFFKDKLPFSFAEISEILKSEIDTLLLLLMEEVIPTRTPSCSNNCWKAVNVVFTIGFVSLFDLTRILFPIN